MDDDQRADGTERTGIFKSLCGKEHQFRRAGQRGGAVRYPPGIPERPGPDPALQGISETETEDAGISDAERGSLPDKADTYTGSIAECENDRQSASAE